jgi:hypothetical protein
MVHRSLIESLILLCAASSGFAQGKDVEGSADHPLFTRMPGFYIDKYEVKDSIRTNLPISRARTRRAWRRSR